MTINATSRGRELKRLDGGGGGFAICSTLMSISKKTAGPSSVDSHDRSVRRVVAR